MHSNGQLRTERDEDTEEGCQKLALQQKAKLIVMVDMEKAVDSGREVVNWAMLVCQLC